MQNANSAAFATSAATDTDRAVGLHGSRNRHPAAKVADRDDFPHAPRLEGRAIGRDRESAVLEQKPDLRAIGDRLWITDGVPGNWRSGQQCAPRNLANNRRAAVNRGKFAGWESRRKNHGQSGCRP